MLIDKLNIILNSNYEFSPKYIISSFVKNNLKDIPTTVSYTHLPIVLATIAVIDST